MRLVPIAALLAVPTLLAAQPPSTRPEVPGRLDPNRRELPSMPVKTLPIEVVAGGPANLGIVFYERLGLKPKEFRIGPDAAMTGATWQPFTEGQTRTKTVNGKTVIVGEINFVLPLGTGTCPANTVKLIAYIQFRTRDLQGNVFPSNIKGSEACVPLGG